jgi:hypothetical protein
VDSALFDGSIYQVEVEKIKKEFPLPTTRLHATHKYRFQNSQKVKRPMSS